MKKLNSNGFIDIEVKQLIDWDEPNGEGCLVSDRITKDGCKVGYMYREEPDDDVPDSGWRFMAGDEDDAYINNPNNVHVFAINTLCNYDNAVVPYLKAKIGSAYIRTENNTFQLDED